MKREREGEREEREGREEDFPPPASSRAGSNFRCKERGEGRIRERWRRNFLPPSPYACVCPHAGEEEGRWGREGLREIYIYIYIYPLFSLFNFSLKNHFSMI